MSITTSTIPIAGLEVLLYEEANLSQDLSLPVAVLFLLHGRTANSKSAHVDDLARRILTYAKEQIDHSGKFALDLRIVSFDHRNHGSRELNKLANLGWGKGGSKDGYNERHALDMYAIQTGTARDVSFLIDFLPAYLYPDGERQIKQWGVVGVSLGGHSTWIALKDEPRLSLGIPIIGCPDYIPLMESRAQQASIELTHPFFPKTFRDYVARHDPAHSPHGQTSDSNPFLGKQILVLSGAADPLVPWQFSQKFVDALEVGENGIKRVVVQEGAKHEVTPEMRDEAAAFVWRWIGGSPGAAL